MNAGRYAELRRRHDEDGGLHPLEVAELFDAIVPTEGESDAMQREIGEWAKRTFPGSPMERIIGCTHHLKEEVDELLQEVLHVSQLADPAESIRHAKSEAADCLILLFNIAHFIGFSLIDAVRGKHIINLHRTWKSPNENGVCEHVKEGA